MTKKNKKEPVRQKWPKEIFKKTEFYFPYKKSLFDPFLTPRQTYKFIKRQGPLRPCQSEIYDSRIAPDMDLEPITLPFAENKIPAFSHNSYSRAGLQAKTGGSTKKAGGGRGESGKRAGPYIKAGKRLLFSVIIPSYNSKTQIINSLKNLALQNFPRNEYEIVLVDDGSEDNTRSAVRNFMRQYPSLNFKAIHFPRAREKSAGEGRFRAGLARNLGAKRAEGEILAFLDADILSPPDYLERLSGDHQKADLVLLKRYHLKAGAPLENLFFDDEKIKKWRYIEEKSYWGDFYKKGFAGVQAPWKYVCSYGLSLPEKGFLARGRFWKKFCLLRL